MSLPVIIVITSAQCGHCRTMRNDGQPVEPPKNSKGEPLKQGIIKGGHHWSPSFIKELISKNGKSVARLIEVYYPTLGPSSVDEALQVNVYNVTNNVLVRSAYSKAPNTNKLAITVNRGGTAEAPKLDDMPYSTFVLSTIPKQLKDFMYIFPAWIMVDGKIWDDAIAERGNLYARASSCKVGEIGTNAGKPSYGVMRGEGYVQAEDPIVNIGKVHDGSLSLIPPPPVPKAVALPVPVPVVQPVKAVVMETGTCRDLGFILIGTTR